MSYKGDIAIDDIDLWYGDCMSSGNVRTQFFNATYDPLNLAFFQIYRSMERKQLFCFYKNMNN